LFENFAEENPGEGRLGEATEEGRALGQVLDEVDDIARATLGSITIATMLKLIERRRDQTPESSQKQSVVGA
jgi:hypothetical protein